jgi:hypothetical protein
MDREEIDRTAREPGEAPEGEPETDVEGHNFEFYRQEARQRAAEAEAQARAAARAREARRDGSSSSRRP